MQLLFIDTSAFYAIADSSDQRHQAASLFSDYAVGKYRFVTTNYTSHGDNLRFLV
jgi:predicted nucleic acid-binding protein